MQLSVTARSRVDPELRSYAVQKLEKLERHDGRIHVARAVLDEDEHRVPHASAEVFVHLHHTRLAARCEGDTLREAIDRVADKMDRQILRQKERLKEHKGHTPAGSEPSPAAPRHLAADATVLESPRPADAD